MTDRPLPAPPLPDDETRTLERAAPDTSPPRESRRAAVAAASGTTGRARRQWSAGHALVVCVLALAHRRSC